MALSSFLRSGLPNTASILWANFSNTATGTYNSGGINYKFLTFSGTGTLTIDKPGLIDVIVCGGGGGRGVSGNGQIISGGGGGGLIYGLFEIAVGSHSITVGGGGAGQTVIGASGTRSTLGTILYAGGGGPGHASWRDGNAVMTGTQGGGYQGGSIEFDSANSSVGMGASANQSNRYDGIASSITGSSVIYSVGGHSGNPTNSGSGGWSGNGQSGIVIVRVAI